MNSSKESTPHLIISHPNTPRVILSDRQLCDIELLFNGGFGSLKNFMSKACYESVVLNMKLLDGTVFPMPIVLDISENTKQMLETGDNSKIKLCQSDGTVLAYLNVSEIWCPNKEQEAFEVYKTCDPSHPGVNDLFHKVGKYYISGTLEKVAHPLHYHFLDLRKTPEQLKAQFKERQIDRIVGFQTRNPMHRAHVELSMRAMQDLDAHLFLHPAVGTTKPGDIDYFTRVKCYQHVLPCYQEGTVTLNLLPISMRMAGPREALWHAIIRKNYGCTHFIIGRDHAGPGKNREGIDFYHPYEAQELVKQYEQMIGIQPVFFQEMVYVIPKQSRKLIFKLSESDPISWISRAFLPILKLLQSWKFDALARSKIRFLRLFGYKVTGRYQFINEIDVDQNILQISGTQFRNMLREGKDIPSWFSYEPVVAELKKVFPPKHQQGITIFLTGLSGSGKSTIANFLQGRLMEIQDRPITLLDGDRLRQQISSELSFSKKDRSISVRRAGFVANEITKNKGIAICALIAPYLEDRQHNRLLIEQVGNYIEIYVKASLEECEKRDPKGLYLQARQGKLKEFTGLDDPYEEPQNPEMTVQTEYRHVHECVNQIISYLYTNGYLFRS
jgi:sulfate adenylyltransferase